MATAKQYRIGIDVGGTKIAAALLRNGRLIESSILATPQDSLEHFIIMVKAAIDPLLAHIEKTKGKLVGIGIGVPSVVNPVTGELMTAANLPILKGAKLAALLTDQLALSSEIALKIDNDANCFVRAEALLGAGKGSNNIYGMIIGTGIGSGWYHNGEMYRGFHGGAQEVGHMIVDFDETITLEKAYHQLTQRNPALLAEEAYRGDILAEKSFEELGSYLGIALSTVVNILDPEVIILGGGIVASSDLFLKAAKENLKKYIFSPTAKKTRLVKGKLGPMAGAMGAALLID